MPQIIMTGLILVGQFFVSQLAETKEQEIITQIGAALCAIAFGFTIGLYVK